MKNQEKKDRFLEMRLLGKTYESIAQELGVSKQTLITWAKESAFQEALSIGTQMRIEAILKKYQIDRMNKIESFATLAQRLQAELSSRDLSNLSPEKILRMLTDTLAHIRDISPVAKFGGESILPDWLDAKTDSFIFDPEN